MSIKVSEEYIGSLFRVQKQAKQETSVKQAVITTLLPEDGGDMLFRNGC
jgi:hypothetical protein